MLSEKAKGKQRARDPPLHVDPVVAPEPELPRELNIRFTEGISDLLISLEPQESVKDVKKKIRDFRPQLQDRRLRLIHSGRLLDDGTSLYPLLTQLEGKHKHTTEEDSDKGNQSEAATIWLHCSVGPKIEDGEENEEGRIQTAQLQPARGFDRLVSVGFSEADIANFRRQFHSQSSSNYLDTDFDTEEEYDEHMRQLEEQWIDSIDSAGTASLSQSASSNSSVIQGILLGFFFPLMPFFYMRKSKPAVFWEDGEYDDGDGSGQEQDNVIFSKQVQMGLVVGFMVNVLFGMWRFLLDTS